MAGRRLLDSWVWTLLLCACCAGAAPAARDRGAGPSRATLAALPTEAELNRLRQLAPSYAEHCRNYELWVHPYQELYSAVMLRLAAEPETWNEADFNARLDAELLVVRAGALAPPPRGERRPYLRLMETPWRVFVAAAPSPQALGARLATLQRFYQDWQELRHRTHYLDASAMLQAIEMYFHRNVDKYATMASRADLFDRLLPPPENLRTTNDPFQNYREQLHRKAQAELNDKALEEQRLERENPPPKRPKGPRAKVDVEKGLSARTKAAQPAKRPDVSDATKKALPTHDEIQSLASLPDVDGADTPEYRARDKRFRQIMDRLADDPAAWTTSDFAARAMGFDRAYRAMYPRRSRVDDPAATQPEIGWIWRNWAVTAPSREEFRTRLAAIECQRALPEYVYQRRTIDKCVAQAIETYLNRNPEMFKGIDAQLDFLDYLRSQAVTSFGIDRVQEWLVWGKGSGIGV